MVSIDLHPLHTEPLAALKSIEEISTRATSCNDTADFHNCRVRHTVH